MNTDVTIWGKIIFSLSPASARGRYEGTACRPTAGGFVSGGPGGRII